MARAKVVRALRGSLKVYLPYSPDNRAWLHDVLGEAIRPRWIKGDNYWAVARSHFSQLIPAAAARFGSVQVDQEYGNVEECTGACKGARPDTVDDCECVCGGRYHADGIGRPGWILVEGGDLQVSSQPFWQTFQVTASTP